MARKDHSRLVRTKEGDAAHVVPIAEEPPTHARLLSLGRTVLPRTPWFFLSGPSGPGRQDSVVTHPTRRWPRARAGQDDHTHVWSTGGLMPALIVMTSTLETPVAGHDSGTDRSTTAENGFAALGVSSRLV